jgi:hypothetical protein
MTDFLDCIRPADGTEPIDDTIPAAETCKLDTWCIRRIHPADEPCMVVPQRELERSDFGPNAATRRRY